MKRFVLISILCACAFGLAFAQYTAKVYTPQGGDSLEVASGGAINVASGGSITNAGTLTQSGTVTNSGATAQTGAFTVGTNGTALTTLRIVRVTVASGATSGTATGTGITANSKVVGQCITLATSNACYVKYAACEAGAVDVVVNTDPGASTAPVDLLIAN